MQQKLRRFFGLLVPFRGVVVRLAVRAPSPATALPGPMSASSFVPVDVDAKMSSTCDHSDVEGSNMELFLFRCPPGYDASKLHGVELVLDSGDPLELPDSTHCLRAVPACESISLRGVFPCGKRKQWELGKPFARQFAVGPRSRDTAWAPGLQSGNGELPPVKQSPGLRLRHSFMGGNPIPVTRSGSAAALRMALASAEAKPVFAQGSSRAGDDSRGLDAMQKQAGIGDKKDKQKKKDKKEKKKKKDKKDKKKDAVVKDGPTDGIAKKQKLADGTAKKKKKKNKDI